MLLCKNIIYHYSDCTFSKLRNSVLWIPVDPKIFSIPFLNQQVKYFKNCRQFPSYSPSRIPTRILPRHFPKSRENPKNNPRETEKSRASSQGSLQFSFEFAVFSFCSRRCRSRKSKSPAAWRHTCRCRSFRHWVGAGWQDKRASGTTIERRQRMAVEQPQNVNLSNGRKDPASVAFRKCVRADRSSKTRAWRISTELYSSEIRIYC